MSASSGFEHHKKVLLKHLVLGRRAETDPANEGGIGIGESVDEEIFDYGQFAKGGRLSPFLAEALGGDWSKDELVQSR
jgi:hypothetical protein